MGTASSVMHEGRLDEHKRILASPVGMRDDFAA